MKLTLVALIFLLLAQFTLSPELARADQTAYVLPENIDIKLEAGEEGKITAIVKPITGCPANLNIRFVSSENLRVKNLQLTMADLHREFSFPVEYEAKTTREKNWIKVLVEYTPDYSSLLEKIYDSKDYSDPDLKSDLITKVKDLANKDQKFTQAAFYRFNGEKTR